VDGAWTARIAPRGDDGERRSPLSSIDLGGLPRDERRGALERAAAEAQASLDLAEGPILRVILFHLGEGEADRVLLAIHHLAIDGVSWRVLLEDFSIAFEAIRRGEPPALPPRTTSFKRWAERLAAHARGPEVGAEAPYWLADERARVRPLLRDRPGGESTVGSTSTLSVALDPDETRALLQEVPRAYNTQINDALLTALLLAVASWTGGRSTLVDLEGHGREELFEDLDLTRTVGWFTSLYPVLLELPGADPDPGEALTAVKEQLRAVPGRGVGYGLLRYLRGDAEVTARLRALPQAEVSFNYLGQLDQAVPEDAGLSMARETAGRTRSPRGARTHLLDVGARVLGGRLQATFAFGEGVHRRETIEALAQGFLAALRSIVAHCAAPDAGGYTPSDFDKRVSKETLARLAAAAMEADSEDFDE
jgi:non-ribosomal peptide synthase protein (TIGR01720 family)